MEKETWNRLPLELRIQILILLPVRALLILRAVSKWFLATIDDPGFVTSHLRHFPGNLNDAKPLVANFTQSDETPNKRREWDYILRGSVDGLGLLVDNKLTHPSMAAELINFSTTKRRYLPPLATYERKQYAFGYDPTRDDYRVVAKTMTRAWVYSVKEKTWTEITKRSGYRGSKKNLSSVACSLCMCFQNALVWTESVWGEPDSFDLVWFGFEDERFYYSDKIPSVGTTKSSGLMKLDGGSTLGLWMVVDDDVAGSIWALRADTMTWVRRHEVPRELVPYGKGVKIADVVERGDGELVSRYWSDEDKSIEVVSYNVHTCEFIRHGKTKYVCSNGDFGCMGGSLIQSLIKF